MSTEDNLLQLFEENVCLTGEEIEEKIYKMSSHNNDIILSLSKDSVVINGEQIIFRRLHIKTRESGDYANVGWVLRDDITQCMICTKPFGIFRYAYNCYACGNLTCYKCSPERQIVTELSDYGPLRVCCQCYWGQATVSARYTTVEDSELEEAMMRWRRSA